MLGQSTFRVEDIVKVVCDGAEDRHVSSQPLAYYQAFFWVLIDLIVELLGLIIKPFDNQTES